MDPNRVQLMSVPESFVFDAFMKMKGRLPEGCEVVGVHHDWITRSFKFVVRHESFPPVPEGNTLCPCSRAWFQQSQLTEEECDKPVVLTCICPRCGALGTGGFCKCGMMFKRVDD